MDLFVIRHGQSTNNVLADMSQRVMDAELTETGTRQAKCVAGLLQSQGHLGGEERGGDGPALDHLYCSPMIRAMQTADAIGRELNLSPEIWVDIHEVSGVYLDHGDERGTVGYPGLTRGEIARLFPEFVVPAEVSDDGWWNKGKESEQEGEVRAVGVAAVLREWGAREMRVGMVTHEGFGSLLLKALGRQIPGDGLLYRHKNTAVTHLSLGPDGQLTYMYQDRAAHLPPDLVT